jgi:hypothetical protein
VVNANNKPKKNLGESIRQRLKNLSEDRERPFDEILRYYAMERFLYRLSISSYSEKFFLKEGLMGKDHIEFKEIIEEISVQIKPLIAMSGNQ